MHNYKKHNNTEGGCAGDGLICARAPILPLLKARCWWVEGSRSGLVSVVPEALEHWREWAKESLAALSDVFYCTSSSFVFLVDQKRSRVGGWRGVKRAYQLFVCIQNFSVFGDFPTLPGAIVFCCSTTLTLEVLWTIHPPLSDTNKHQSLPSK